MYRRNIQHVLIPLAIGLILFLAYQLYFKPWGHGTGSARARPGNRRTRRTPHGRIAG
jgi:hypothetical protein